MTRRVLGVALLVFLAGCNTQPSLFDPRTAPILLDAGAYAHTDEPERFRCKNRAVLLCERIGGVRGSPSVDCTCLP